VAQVVRPDASELRLRLLHNATACSRWLHLHAGWVDTLASPGDTLNVIHHTGYNWIADDCGTLHATLTNGREGLAILHPDLLLSGTAVSTSLRCPRQAMLQECGIGAPSKAACLGTLMHKLVQAALDALARGALPQAAGAAELGRPLPVPRGTLPSPHALPALWLPPALCLGVFLSLPLLSLTSIVPKLAITARKALGGWGTPRVAAVACAAPTGHSGAGSAAATRARHVHAYMQSRVSALVSESVHDLAEAGLSQREAEVTIREAAGRLSGTIATHYQSDSGAPVCLEGVVDIEESIWAPKYGIKGVIDATMLARFPGPSTRPPVAGGSREGTKFGLVPVEFKSGKRYHSHAAQACTYLLLSCIVCL
jgi:hypothetical protein